jgi:hypothetical protein
MQDKIDDKINSAPLAALQQLEVPQPSDSKSCCMTFFCCCCDSDDEGQPLEPMSQQAQESLALLIEKLNEQMIPLQQFNQSNPRRTTVADTAILQRERTKKILENAISRKAYPELPDDIIAKLRIVLEAFPNDNDLNEDESLDSGVGQNDLF